jgi:hypothetical protein
MGHGQPLPQDKHRAVTYRGKGVVGMIRSQGTL